MANANRLHPAVVRLRGKEKHRVLLQIGGFAMAHQQAMISGRGDMLHSIVLIEDEEQTGVYRYLLTLDAGRLFPISRDWFPAEANAKKLCLEDFGIGESEWKHQESEPEWIAVFRVATDMAIRQYREGVMRQRDQ